MDHLELRERFATLTTAHLADACIRAQIPVRCAPALLRAVIRGSRLLGARLLLDMSAVSMFSWRRLKTLNPATYW
jgi:hypothetical protein